MTTSEELHDLAAQVRGAMPDLTSDEQRLALTLYRMLAEGRPVAVTELAARTGLPQPEVDHTLGRWPGVFTDDGGRVVGFWGLALSGMPHRFEVDGHELFTWCAWDALFIAPLLGRPARVTSTCPATGATVRLTVTPAGVADVSPDTAVLSFVRPDQPFDEDVVSAFCHYVLLFASPEAARTWVDEQPGTFVLSVDDGFQLGQLTNRARLGGALDGHAATPTP